MLYEVITTSEALTWSDEQYRIYGYEPGSVEPSAELVHAHIHPDDRTDFLLNVAHAYDEGLGKYENEYRVVRNDGSVRYVQSWGEAEFDEAGQADQAHRKGACRSHERGSHVHLRRTSFRKS